MANVLSLVSYKIFPAKLGGQKGIALFNKYLSKYHKLTCVTIKDNDPSFADYKVLNILSNSKLRYINFFYFFTLRRIINQNNISHVIIEHPYYGWMGMLLKWFCRVKLIVHSHNIEGLRFKSVGKWWWGILWNYEKWVHKSAHHTFCITEEDRQYMIKCFNLTPTKTTTITYGIEWDAPPSSDERQRAKEALCKKYTIHRDTLLYLFNGTLHYGPNLEAVRNIVNNINPVLLIEGINYKIIICGKGLPGEMGELKEYADKSIIYAGCVEDISIYFKGADVFINPVVEGGGIKTKLVEALGYNLNVVSSTNGAIGVDMGLCNRKLLLAKDNDWASFAGLMKDAININTDIPGEFFRHFYWDNIAQKAAAIITTQAYDK
jgi:polysaccharide biosynthesis protein PslH